MSLVLNMSGGGAPEPLLWANDVPRSDLSAAAVCNGSSDLAYLLPASVSGAANSAQYAYLRVGPVNLSGISVLQAALDTSVGGSGNGSTRVVLFVAQGDNARAWEVPAAQATVETYDGPVSGIGPQLNVSALDGNYYVYAGTDSGGVSWGNPRSARVYSVISYAAT
ncbi:MAG: hypothetical protein IJI06_09860 [Oscillospiraceae bacterium]|nr:hypothetical protein [Oscillospiraceae bacterium]